jgi:hypothetical protein
MNEKNDNNSWRQDTKGATKGRSRYWALFLLLLVSCHSNTPSKRITIWRQGKMPYGTYVAFDGLPYLFPNADITINRKSPLELTTAEGKKVYLIITQQVDPTGPEINALLNFVGEGNHVFISAFSFGDSLLRALKVSQSNAYNYSDLGDSLQLSVYNPLSADSLSFGYPGYAYDGWASSIDSQYTTIVGRDAKGRPDFIRFNYKGGGSLFLHFAPLAFSNYFLLYKKNKAYYDNALSYLPASVKEVIWDDYFRYDNRSGNGDFSAFQYILKSPPLRWAFGLLLLLFGLIYLFESKRKQRMVPVIAGLRNNSLDFVRTIGRLYYQRRDNHNLAVKMATHFQDHIRTKYNLHLATDDPAFVNRLSFRTGIPKDKLESLMGDISYLQEQRALTDDDLLAFHKKIEEFYSYE